MLLSNINIIRQIVTVIALIKMRYDLLL